MSNGTDFNGNNVTVHSNGRAELQLLIAPNGASPYTQAFAYAYFGPASTGESALAAYYVYGQVPPRADADFNTILMALHQQPLVSRARGFVRCRDARH